jgi:dienelactone hydrolase
VSAASLERTASSCAVNSPSSRSEALEAWPQVSVQIHYAQDDPLVDVDQVRALEAAARESGVSPEIHVYDGVGHLFEDAGLPGHDEAAAQLMSERVLAFLAKLEATARD